MLACERKRKVSCIKINKSSFAVDDQRGGDGSVNDETALRRFYKNF